MDLARGTLLRIMPQFVIEREIQGAGSLSEAQIREVSLRSLETLKEMGPQIQWLHSYVTEDKVYCVYLAPDENSIREHALRAAIPGALIFLTVFPPWLIRIWSSVWTSPSRTPVSRCSKPFVNTRSNV